MILPSNVAMITVGEARDLMKFIEKSTSTKTIPVNYKKMHEAGVADIYESLRCFVENYNKQMELNDLDISRISYD